MCHQLNSHLDPLTVGDVTCEIEVCETELCNSDPTAEVDVQAATRPEEVEVPVGNVEVGDSTGTEIEKMKEEKEMEEKKKKKNGKNKKLKKNAKSKGGKMKKRNKKRKAKRAKTD